MILIFGAGGHAKVIANFLRLTTPNFITEERDKSILTEINSESIVYLGIGDNAVRANLGKRLLHAGAKIPNVIGPNTYINENSEIGVGNFIGAGAMVLPNSRIGNFVIVNTQASVDHNCVLEDGSQLAAGVHLGGGTIVGSESLVGMGAVTLPGIKIGKRCQIMAGSVVNKDIPDNMVFGGNPGRLIKQI